jgi:hypothetical protein
MSEEPTSDDFDIRLWLIEQNVSEPGLKKIQKNEISDQKLLLELTMLDITHLKLGVGDRRRLIGGIDALRKTVSTGAQPLESVSPVVDQLPRNTVDPTSSGEGTSGNLVGSSGTGSVNGAPSGPSVNAVSGGGSAVGATPNGGSAVSSAGSSGTEVTQKTNFTIDEVSNFLAGSVLPQNLLSSVAQAQARQNQLSVQNSVVTPVVSPVVSDPRTLECGRPPFLPPHFPPLNNGHFPVQHLQNASPGNVNPAWLNRFPYNHQQNQQPWFGGNTTIPVYSPQRPAFVPSRLTAAVADPSLQQFGDQYHTASLHDLLTINECNAGVGRQGEQLFLPCNFVSHVRGSTRTDDEELLTTVSGSKLYLSNNRKVAPEKLSYGLFFGANARILARLIPNLTPDLAAYLDYLRKLGDIMVNYTASSVFLLDHVHRYEVIEEGKTWNYIDPSLSLNVLKKRDASVSSQGQSNSTVSRANTVSRLGGNSNSQQRQTQRSTTVICWLFNQHEGCTYGAGCRFLHICNIVACGADHPAYKHVFRGQSTNQSSATQSQSAAAKSQSK